MSASVNSARSRPVRPAPKWLARAQQRIADLVLPGRLGFGVVSLREIEDL